MGIIMVYTSTNYWLVVWNHGIRHDFPSYWEESSQLTNSYFTEGQAQPPTSVCICIYIYIHIYHRDIQFIFWRPDKYIHIARQLWLDGYGQMNIQKHQLSADVHLWGKSFSPTAIWLEARYIVYIINDILYIYTCVARQFVMMFHDDLICVYI